MTILPRSLATRTTLVLLAGLAVVQVSGLTLHALDRVELMQMAQLRDIAVRSMNIYRSVALASADARGAIVDELGEAADIEVAISTSRPQSALPEASLPLQRQVRADLTLVPMPASRRPHDVVVFGTDDAPRIAIGLQMPERDWLVLHFRRDRVWPWQSETFLTSFAAMSAAALVLTLWAVRRLTAPVATLAAAAEALGRDVNAAPLDESGPTEVATAAMAFNTMARRIRRFVDDRTFMLTAIGHDLRTPITRLRLRSEFIEDEEQRTRILGDLDDLEAMVSATLTFGRDATLTEPAVQVDLVALVRTVLDEAADARPGLGPGCFALAGPATLTVVARPVALKRALTNLVANALNYGGSAHAILMPPEGGLATLHIDDNGPGIAPSELDRMFLPFQRLDSSRNRQTGGVGLGLPIARNILRAHGGDVTIANRRNGGLRATVTLPA